MQYMLRYQKFIVILFFLSLSPVILTFIITENFFESTSGHFIWLLSWIPYILYPLAAYLGFRLNQSRIVYASFSFFLYFLIITFSQHTLLNWISSIYLLSASSLALPISIIGIFSLPEGRIWGTKGIYRLAMSVLPLSLLLYLSYNQPSFTAKYLFHCSTLTAEFWKLPLIVFPLVLTIATLMIVFYDKRIIYFSIAAIAGLLIFIFAVNRTLSNIEYQYNGGVIFSISYTVIAFLFLYSLYHLYWEKAYIDDLTGIPNRRTLNEKLEKLGKHYSVAMIDIDYFKALNDTYGHTEGDNILRYIASNLDQNFKNCVYRYGGEEFCVLFDGMPMKKAAKKVDNFRKYLSNKKFYLRQPEQIRNQRSKKDRGESTNNSHHVFISFSAGMGYRDIPDEKPIDIIEQADKALYASKRGGRNQVLCYGSPEVIQYS